MHKEQLTDGIWNLVFGIREDASKTIDASYSLDKNYLLKLVFTLKKFPIPNLQFPIPNPQFLIPYEFTLQSQQLRFCKLSIITGCDQPRICILQTFLCFF